MATHPRHDFPAGVRNRLGERVGFHCSNPTCRALTTGPTLDPSKSLRIGVGAHITAAAPGGPRYDESLLEEERRAASNGIWLCQNCAKLVDNDADRYSPSMLLHWKEVAEDFALNSIGKSGLFSIDRVPTSTFDRSFLQKPDKLILPLPSDLADLWTTPPAKGASFTLLAEGLNVLGLPFLVVAVERNYGQDWQIVYFVVSEAGWFPQATIILRGQKGHEPAVEYLPGLPGTLLVGHVTTTGTGVFRRELTFYRIGVNSAEAIISIPTEFYVTGWGMPYTRHLKLTSLKNPKELSDGATLTMEFEVNYSILYIDPVEITQSSETLVSQPVRLILTWSAAATQFVPFGPTDDFSILDEIWNEDLEGFAARYREELSVLAISGSISQRAFVKRYIASA